MPLPADLAVSMAAALVAAAEKKSFLREVAGAPAGARVEGCRMVAQGLNAWSEHASVLLYCRCQRLLAPLAWLCSLCAQHMQT